MSGATSGILDVDEDFICRRLATRGQRHTRGRYLLPRTGGSTSSVRCDPGDFVQRSDCRRPRPCTRPRHGGSSGTGRVGLPPATLPAIATEGREVSPKVEPLPVTGPNVAGSGASLRQATGRDRLDDTCDPGCDRPTVWPVVASVLPIAFVPSIQPRHSARARGSNRRAQIAPPQSRQWAGQGHGELDGDQRQR